jgi:hypothetical protein
MLSVASLSASAQTQNGQGGNNNNQGGYYGAPGPVVAAGLPGLAFGVGYGIYWLRSRSRQKAD